MKKMMMIFASVMLTMTACAGHPQLGSFSELPAPAQEFITTHFSQNDIAWVQWEWEGVHKEWEVKLFDDTFLDFYNDGSLRKIECKRGMAVPDGIVPASIVSYVQGRFPNGGIFIKEYYIGRRTQEVELSNGLDLVFDLNGNFKYIDD